MAGVATESAGNGAYQVRGEVSASMPAARGTAVMHARATGRRSAGLSATTRGELTLIRPDGGPGGVFPLHDGESVVGRGQGALFASDPYLSPRHAELLFGDHGLVVRDLRSRNGVFLRVTQEEPLEWGQMFRLGRQLLRLDHLGPPVTAPDGTTVMGGRNPGFWGRLSVVAGPDHDAEAFGLSGDAVVLGRERGDVLLPEDRYVSGTHARITLRGGRAFLADLGSSNGTFVRVRGARVIPSGSVLLLGQQLFRATYR
jgi:pSer/pThr/pTyr-binding forkhead associated (FHA) protein